MLIFISYRCVDREEILAAYGLRKLLEQRLQQIWIEQTGTPHQDRALNHITSWDASGHGVASCAAALSSASVTMECSLDFFPEVLRAPLDNWRTALAHTPSTRFCVAVPNPTPSNPIIYFIAFENNKAPPQYSDLSATLCKTEICSHQRHDLTTRNPASTIADALNITQSIHNIDHYSNFTSYFSANLNNSRSLLPNARQRSSNVWTQRTNPPILRNIPRIFLRARDTLLTHRAWNKLTEWNKSIKPSILPCFSLFEEILSMLHNTLRLTESQFSVAFLSLPGLPDIYPSPLRARTRSSLLPFVLGEPVMPRRKSRRRELASSDELALEVADRWRGPDTSLADTREPNPASRAAPASGPRLEDREPTNLKSGAEQSSSGEPGSSVNGGANSQDGPNNKDTPETILDLFMGPSAGKRSHTGLAANVSALRRARKLNASTHSENEKNSAASDGSVFDLYRGTSKLIH